MFMRRPSYLGEDFGSQALAGQSSRVLKKLWINPKVVSQIVSHRLQNLLISVLLNQRELEAKVGIGQGSFTVQAP